MSKQDLLLDLMTSQATEGLSDEEAMELMSALEVQTELDMNDLELAAAAADLAFQSAAPTMEPMPAHLRQRILDQAAAHLPKPHATTMTADAGDAVTVVPFRAEPAPQTPAASTKQPSLLSTSYLGWYIAAAVLALALWSPWTARQDTPTPTPTLAELRTQFIANASDLVQVDWAQPEIEAYAQVVGDVVWSDQRQTGYMRLRGLPANQSSVEQYQLWIVDPTRDARPIDGGVFDIPAGADEVIVPIDAKLRADGPTVFAITLEQPGGVVVSDGPLLVIASTDA